MYIVDAFTNEPFRGNPAGVCLLSGPADTKWMQNVAAELKHSETAFVYRDKEIFRIRFFTPICEIDLCGHATLASAHVLFSTGLVEESHEIHFLAKGGNLSAKKKNSRVELSFPALLTKPREFTEPLKKALREIGKPLFVGSTKQKILIEALSETLVRNMKPDFSYFHELKEWGVIVTACADKDKPYDFVSRTFVPKMGIDEDPVTGVAHCVLAPYWAKRLGKLKMHGYQASARGGHVWVRVNGDRVELSGDAVTIIKGELAV